MVVRGARRVMLRTPRFLYSPMQLVAPSAVIIAVAILAIICRINFTVSFLLITHLLS